MPFGLTKAPATFQCLMNEIFAPILRKFVLVFFDDILVYSPTLEAHKEHLKEVLRILQQNQLFVKESKCTFAQRQVEYSGHIISERGVEADARKVEAMRQWPNPKCLKSLRGFLGPTGYYKRFVPHYGVISKPLTSLLKKGAFKWSEEAEKAFNKLKDALANTPVLTMPDFSKPFVLETDACKNGVGAVLMQEGKPIAYMSKSLSQRHLGLSTYEKELLAIVMAVKKWRNYLLGHKFIIKTDHEALKYFMEQKLTTLVQQKWVSKLLGFDYSIQYKKGKENLVADALSRRQEGECSYLTTEVTPTWKLEVGKSMENDNEAQELIAQLLIDAESLPEYQYKDGILRKQGKIYLCSSGEVRQKIMELIRSTPEGGHSGIATSIKRAELIFFWPTLKKDLAALIKGCEICQRNKVEHVPSPGLLQPLPIPNKAWEVITMDFVEGLPKSEGMDVVLVVVDKLTKYCHLMSLSHPYSASQVA